jgi:hypothetical protein
MACFDQSIIQAIDRIIQGYLFAAVLKQNV